MVGWRTYCGAGRDGFTLVELSIVLVILGLLAGGVMTGQSLIRAAELRAVSTEYSKYSIAVMSFQDRYMAIPGDMKDATRFWGKDAAVCNSHSGTAQTPGACNGDGDGKLSHPNNGTEVYQFWKHLALAGLIDGSYTGKTGHAPSPMAHFPGINCPASRMNDGGWGAYYDISANAWRGNVVRSSNTLMFGRSAVASGNYAAAPILTPKETWSIDTKIDDGAPDFGQMIVSRYNGWPCATSDDLGYNASYNLGIDTQTCSILFIDQF